MCCVSQRAVRREPWPLAGGNDAADFAFAVLFVVRCVIYWGIVILPILNENLYGMHFELFSK